MVSHRQHRLGTAEHDADLRAAEQFVAAGGDHVGAVGPAWWRRPARRQHRVGCEQSATEIDDEGGTPRSALNADNSRTETLEVKPVTRKLLGCT